MTVLRTQNGDVQGLAYFSDINLGILDIGWSDQIEVICVLMNRGNHLQKFSLELKKGSGCIITYQGKLRKPHSVRRRESHPVPSGYSFG